MRFILGLLIVFMGGLCAASVAAQSAVSDFTAQLDQIVPPLLEQYQIAGASVAVIHDNEVVWTQGYGVTDEDSGAPVTADTPFSVESIGKALTAWEIMRLVEAGQIDLDAPVNQYLTSWQLASTDRDDANEVTIRRILSHTAGLSVDGYSGYAPGRTVPGTVELINGDANAAAVRITLTPGTRFSYSGGGYTILQQMIEDVTGEPFAQVMQSDLLDPLGMDHSSFEWSEALGAATAYTLTGQVDTEVVHADLAAGGLYTSASDLARFFTDGLHGDWLAPESVALMHTPADATGGEYGFGNFIFQATPDETVIWHDGIGVGTRSIFFLIPQTGDGLIILTNKGSGNLIFREIVCAWDLFVNGEKTKLCRRW